jgi:hypothetical protein
MNSDFDALDLLTRGALWGRGGSLNIQWRNTKFKNTINHSNWIAGAVMYLVIVGVLLVYTWSRIFEFAISPGSPIWLSWPLISIAAHLSVVTFLAPIKGESWWWLNLRRAHEIVFKSLLWYIVLMLLGILVVLLTENVASYWLCISAALAGYSIYWNSRVIEDNKQNWSSSTDRWEPTTKLESKTAKPRKRGPFRIWWDFENMTLSPDGIRGLVEALPGRKVPGFSFSDPRRITAAQTKALYRAKVPCILVPDNRRQASDKVMRSRMRNADVGPSITEVVVTNDGDFTPEVRLWSKKGAKVWIITNDTFSRRLVHFATWHTRIRDLINWRSLREDHRCRYCGARVRSYWTWCGNCKAAL